MKGRPPGGLSGQGGILSDLTKALAERALNTEMDGHLKSERSEEPFEAATCPGRSITEREINLENGSKLFRQTDPPLHDW